MLIIGDRTRTAARIPDAPWRPLGRRRHAPLLRLAIGALLDCASGQHGCPDRGGETYQPRWESGLHRQRWWERLGDGAGSPSSGLLPVGQMEAGFPTLRFGLRASMAMTHVLLFLELW